MPRPHRDGFIRDGFTCVADIIDQGEIAALHEAFERVFHGEFDTGIAPDEVNWQYEDGDPSRTRQICNGWKADAAIASVVRRPELGRAVSELMGWNGARLIQDNVLWKPPGAASLGFHRDNDYSRWFSPAQMATCWIALDDTTAEGGTLEFAVGSHLWGPSKELRTAFHAPADYRADLATSAPGADPLIAPVVVAAGGGSFHHGDTWHGSAPNRSDSHRRALVIHCAPAEAEFDLTNLEQGMGPVYGRYCDGTATMPGEHFPVLWLSG